LLGPFFVGTALGVDFSSNSSNRSGALRFREGRELGVAAGAGFLAAAFFGADFLGAGFLGAGVFFFVVLALVAELVLLAVRLGGGVSKAGSSSSSSTSSRDLFGLCLATRLAPMLEVGRVEALDAGASACSG